MNQDLHRPAPTLRRRLGRSYLFFAVGIASLAAPGRLLAAPEEVECGPNFGDVTIGDGQTLSCDLNVIGGSVLVAEGATVEGSLNVMTGSARILGTVTEDVVAGRDLAIEGLVGGNAFAIGGDIDVGGRVEGKATTARGDIRLASGAWVGGPLSARGAVTLAADSTVASDVLAGEAIDQDPAATIEGRSLEHESSSGYSSAPGSSSSGSGVPRALLLGAFLMLAMLFTAMTQLALPNQIGRIAAAASASPGRMILLGLIALLATPFSWILLVTIPLSALALAMGWVGLGAAWGRSVAPRRSAAVQAAIGGLLLAALLMLLLALMAAFPQLLAFCGLSLLLAIPLAWAYGAAVMTLLGTRTTQRAPAPALSEANLPLSPPPAPADPSSSRPQPEGEPPVVPPPMAAEPGAWPAPPPAPLVAPGDPVGLPLPGAADLGAGQGSQAPAGAEGQPGAAPEMERPPSPGEPDQAPAPAGSDPLPEAAEGPHDELRHGPPLRQVIGLSPIYAELLRGAGILGAKDLAALSPDEVSRLTQAPGVLAAGTEKAAAWIQAARGLLADSH